MKLQPYVINHNEEKFPRKNLYLLDQAEGKQVSKDHPYLQALRDYEEKEKDFLGKLVSSKSSDDIEELRVRQKVASEKVSFYEPFTELTYDAELKYNNALVEQLQLPMMIKTLEDIGVEKAALEKEKKEFDPKADEPYKAFLKKEHERLKRERDEELKRIKLLRDNRSISEKAAENMKKAAKRTVVQEYDALKVKLPSRYLKEREKALNFREKREKKTFENFIQSEKDSNLQTIPVETMGQRPWRAWVSFLVPGLGQVLNGQPIKAILFFLGTLFIYLMAIPYALGYGNYQGEGVGGLVNLAVGGARLDRSLYFMIEGVIAIFLLLFALAIFYFSFKDVRRVEKSHIQGKRPNNWSIVKHKIFDEGFPYTVTLPSAVLITFIVLVPVVTVFLLSFAGMDPQNQSKFGWVGLQNYISLIQGSGLAGSLFWRILVWTLIWTFGATTLSIITGFFLALLINNDRIIGKGLFKTIYILPWAIPGFISILFFSIMFSPGGYLSTILNDLVGTEIFVKSNTFWTRSVLIAMKVWLGSSYIFLLSLGVLQSIPKDLYEAAEIDGASPWQKLIKITVPLVLFQTAPLLVGQYTFNFNDFSAIFLFNQGGPFNTSLYGNLAGSSDILISYIYKLTIDNAFQSIGAAIAILISFALMFFAYIGLIRSKAFKEMK